MKTTVLLTLNGKRSSAVINGRVLCLGEALSNAVLVGLIPNMPP